jgi:hypothetical protein
MVWGKRDSLLGSAFYAVLLFYPGIRDYLCKNFETSYGHAKNRP